MAATSRKPARTRRKFAYQDVTSGGFSMTPDYKQYGYGQHYTQPPPFLPYGWEGKLS